MLLTFHFLPSPHELKVIHQSIFQLDGANPKSMSSAQFLHFNPQVLVYRMTLDIAEKYAEAPSEEFLEEVTCQLGDESH